MHVPITPPSLQQMSAYKTEQAIAASMPTAYLLVHNRPKRLATTLQGHTADHGRIANQCTHLPILQQSILSLLPNSPIPIPLLMANNLTVSSHYAFSIPENLSLVTHVHIKVYAYRTMAAIIVTGRATRVVNSIFFPICQLLSEHIETRRTS